MKRNSIIAMTAALCICGSLAGCGGSSSSSGNTSKSTEAKTAAASSEAESTSPAEASTEPESEAAESTSMPTELTDNIMDYRFSIGGNIVGLPATFKDLKDAGWEIKGDKSAITNNYGYYFDLKKDDCMITVWLQNDTDEKADLKTDEGAAIVKVSSVMATTMWNKSNIEIPKNIVAGVAAPEDVANAYGQPTEIINNTEQGSITYYYYEGEKVEDHKNLDRFIAVLFTRKDKDDNNSPVVMERISMQWENY